MSDDPRGRRQKPSAIGDVLASLLADAGIAERVEQANVVPEWTELVGTAIASVTEPLYITADGTLFVAVSTNGWMTELALMEPDLLRALNAKEGRAPVRKLRFQLRR